MDLDDHAIHSCEYCVLRFPAHCHNMQQAKRCCRFVMVVSAASRESMVAVRETLIANCQYIRTTMLCTFCVHESRSIGR